MRGGIRAHSTAQHTKFYTPIVRADSDRRRFASQPTDELAVYAAADEVASCVELRQHFPSSQVMCNDVGVEMAGLDTRMSRLSLLYLLADIFHLAESDFFVATFSSHVARLVYELMQDCTRLESPASARATSLDDKWYYSG